MSSQAQELEELAARIADDANIDWRLADRAGGQAGRLDGMRELSELARAFRRGQHGGHVSQRPAGAPLFRFAGLDVLAPLGIGSQGEVYRAFDPVLDQFVALKLRRLDSDTLNHQFLHEARTMARLRHPNILSIYGAAVDDGQAGLWSELIEGETLAAILRREGPLPSAEVEAIGIELCGALAAVHKAGLVHGDIKAENVLRDADGRIVLADFGASASNDELANRAAISGTVHYLAPEVLAGQAPSAASDQYALAVLLYRLASGRFPYEGRNALELEQAQRAGPPRLERANAGSGRALASAIARGLALQPARRHRGISAFAQALTATAVPDATRPLLATTALAAALLVGAALWLASSRTPPAAWSAEAQLLRVSERSQEALADHASVRLGDRLQLRFLSTRATHVYVFDDDGSAAVAVLFPLAGMQPQNPLPAQVETVLPGSEGGKALSWQVNSTAQREEFLIIASEQALPALDAIISNWLHAAIPAAELRPRGASALTAAPLPTAVESAALRGVLEQIAHDPAAAQIRQWHYILPHEKS